MYKPVVMDDGSKTGDQNRNGIFVYSTSHHGSVTSASIEGSGGVAPLLDAVTFVFKIETMNTTVYIWKVSCFFKK